MRFDVIPDAVNGNPLGYPRRVGTTKAEITPVNSHNMPTQVEKRGSRRSIIGLDIMLNVFFAYIDDLTNIRYLCRFSSWMVNDTNTLRSIQPTIRQRRSGILWLTKNSHKCIIECIIGSNIVANNDL